MIDIHAHILPGLDDGPETLDEAIEMMRIAEKNGIKTLVATPHILSPLSKIRTFSQLTQVFTGFKHEVQRQGIKVDLLPGAEVLFVSELAEKIKAFREHLTINGSRYFLVEFPPEIVFPGSVEYIFNLVTQGFIPIIAHPEKNEVFQENPRLLFDILQAGALSQVDAGSLTGEFGLAAHSTALTLIDHNLVHIIASDCHHVAFRKPGFSFLNQKKCAIPADRIELMTEKIPRAVINDAPIPDIGPMQVPGTHKKSFFQLFREVFR